MLIKEKTLQLKTSELKHYFQKRYYIYLHKVENNRNVFTF